MCGLNQMIMLRFCVVYHDIVDFCCVHQNMFTRKQVPHAGTVCRPLDEQTSHFSLLVYLFRSGFSEVRDIIFKIYRVVCRLGQVETLLDLPRCFERNLVKQPRVYVIYYINKQTKYYGINLELIMKETDFPTKNCRSAKKITQLRQVLKSNATFVVKMYIYRTKKYFVQLYKRCMFNLLLMHFSFLSSSILC